MRRLLPAVLLAAACHHAAPAGVENAESHPSARHTPDGSLYGPFARLDDAPVIQERGDPDVIPAVRELARSGGEVSVSLRSVDFGSSIDCVVALETGEGLYTSQTFECGILRSDLTMWIEGPTISRDGDDVTMRLRRIWRPEAAPDQVEDLIVTCHVGDPMSCSVPPDPEA
jgi:hypothetical protein